MSDTRNPIVVLLVDDQAFIGAAVAAMLASEQDLQLRFCGQPQNAISMARDVRPSVILQDLVLPDVDGLAMVAEFRKDPATAATPIVVLSGKDSPETRSRARAAGATDYCVKMPAKEELVAIIRRLASGSAVGQGAARMARLKSAVAAGDAATVKAAAEELRAAAATHGASQLEALCQQLARHADRGGRGNVLAVLVGEIEQEFSRFSAALGSHGGGPTAA